MSFDATRATWAARRSGALCAGSTLLVALAMADATYGETGELVAGSRGIGALCGMSHATVIGAQRELEAAGVIERVELGRGSRPSRWRWKLAPPPNTGTPRPVDNNGQRLARQPQTVGEPTTNGKQWYSNQPPVVGQSNEYQDHAYTRVSGDELVAPSAVPAHVATLRDALGGGGRRGALSDGAARAGTTPAAAANGDELCATEADGWTP